MLYYIIFTRQSGIVDKDVGGVKNEAAYHKRGVDADDDSRDTSIEKTRRKHSGPKSKASPTSVAEIAPTEPPRVARPRGGPRSPSKRHPKPPIARSPCSPANGQAGATAPSERKCKIASTVPNDTAVKRIANAAIIMAAISKLIDLVRLAENWR